MNFRIQCVPIYDDPDDDEDSVQMALDASGYRSRTDLELCKLCEAFISKLILPALKEVMGGRHE
jgi:hypothetical protein